MKNNEKLANQMVEKYKARRAEGWTHSAAVMDVIHGRRNRAALDLFFNDAHIAAEYRKHNATVKV
jgi:hypothetical protein